ncbi:ser/threonine protein phosphatase [Alicyclobacillus hesperidum subsp. aegles]|uniref:metallophosphoesterase n=1 Tax=Alicyclobacillus hesperidum TaxID=89784 RepID=UPI00222C30E9|nr:metallophosphoesterase [Alicyclobacillus hesperidum]GLG01036.1 ser/threonine protein phosphatase [Alicyclobacillus hesperidum subsp. aegles]
MAIYAIGDLHLGSSVNKPMDIFGALWKDHVARIRFAWEERVTDSDIVCIPGDISWAMTLDEARSDLHWIRQLPGTKILIRGNHDYWWSGIQKVRQCMDAQTFALQNDCIRIGEVCFAGTRGWLLPSHPSFTEDDAKLLHREEHRLTLSLEEASRTNLPIVCMMHYPPVDSTGESSTFSSLLQSYNVKVCLYGHLHGASHKFAYNGYLEGVYYRLVSSDYLGFTPFRIPDEWLI